MSIRLTPEQRAFQTEVDAFLRSAVQPGLFVEEVTQSDEQRALLQRFVDQLVERGWLTIGWPKEYGGGGRSVVEQAIFNERMGYHHAPRDALAAVTIFGPAIYLFGTPEQKALHLPLIARGEGRYWQLFTEPGAGSDLASLQTSAVRSGDDFVVNGQKVFVGYGWPADYFYLAARTDRDAPKHRGISIFLIDAHAPGVSVSDLEPVAGWMKNQVFLDDVRVPASALMGRLNEGWAHMRETLAVERSGIALAAEFKRTLEDVVGLCQTLERDGTPLIEHPEVQLKLADMLIEVEGLLALCWRVVWMQANDLQITTEASISSLAQKDFYPRLAGALYDITGSYAILNRMSAIAPLHGELEYLQRESLHTHGGGTPEIQRNVISIRGLGLPR